MAEFIEKHVNTSFEQAYFRVRKQEGRILTSTQIKSLPRLKNDPNSEEWEYRWKSTDRLINYIRNLRPKTVMDLGCGNGWLCFKLAGIADEVIGVDVNREELNQASEILSNFNNVKLIYSNIIDDEIDHEIDLVVINASIQYFPDLKNLIKRLSSCLKRDGEIHIIDSPFYSNSAATSAKNRSVEYYKSLNEAEMTEYYFHHRWSELNGINYELLYDPRKFISRLKQKLRLKDSPFPWIKITL